MKSDLILAKGAAIEAGGLILNYYKADYEIKDKGYHNPVTTADNAADTRLREILTEARPEYGWLSEETVDSPERLTKKRVWVVDPLDGTTNFSRGIPLFAASIALMRGPSVVLGVIYHPLTGDCYAAERGGGCWRNDERLSVSQVADPELAVLYLTHGYPTADRARYGKALSRFAPRSYPRSCARRAARAATSEDVRAAQNCARSCALRS